MKVAPGLLSSSVRDLSVAALALAGAFAAGRYALADGPTPAAPRVIPYEGILELNGESVAGTKSFAFEIWDSPGAGGTRLWPIDATPDGQLESVPLTNGRFAVQLGGEGMDALPDSVFSAPVTYLTVSVDGVALSNRQRLVNPWLAANGPVTINGTLDVNGEINSGTLGVVGDLTVSGSVDVAGSLDAGDITVAGAAIEAPAPLLLNTRSNAGVSIGGNELDSSNGGGILRLTNSTRTMYMDADEINTSGTLYLNFNSNQPVHIDGDLQVVRNVYGSGPAADIDNPYASGPPADTRDCDPGLFVCGLSFYSDGRIHGARCCGL